jgi:hypothetical protein
MKPVLDSIETLTRKFAQLEYFRILEGPPQRTDVDVMARGLLFFVMAFQDMLRINTQLVKDPMCRGLVEAQRSADAGHDNWYLSDLRRLGIEPSLRWVFGKSHERTRDTSYEIIAELFAAPDDVCRLVVGLVLEATGGEYFSRVQHFFTALGLVEGYRFFGGEHWAVEQDHGPLDGPMRKQLLAISLSEASRQQALGTAARVFASVSRMCDDLSAKMLDARAGGQSWSEQPSP